VKDLANAVAEAIPGTRVTINPDAVPDKRSYQVSFDKFKALAPDHGPKVSLEEAVRGLNQGLQRMQFKDANFRDSEFMRLKVLNDHIASGRLNDSLEWIG
jgi:hypothetical protein